MGYLRGMKKIMGYKEVWSDMTFFECWGVVSLFLKEWPTFGLAFSTTFVWFLWLLEVKEWRLYKSSSFSGDHRISESSRTDVICLVSKTSPNKNSGKNWQDSQLGVLVFGNRNVEFSSQCFHRVHLKVQWFVARATFKRMQLLCVFFVFGSLRLDLEAKKSNSIGLEAREVAENYDLKMVGTLEFSRLYIHLCFKWGLNIPVSCSSI